MPDEPGFEPTVSVGIAALRRDRGQGFNGSTMRRRPEARSALLPDRAAYAHKGIFRGRRVRKPNQAGSGDSEPGGNPTRQQSSRQESSMEAKRGSVTSGFVHNIQKRLAGRKQTDIRLQ